MMLGPATFSIAACDLATGEFGVAVQSKFFAVGAAVPYARTGAGAVATQAWFDPSHGERALSLLEGGASASQVLDRLLADDPGKKGRQIGLVDRHGHAAAYTGPACNDWAGHEVGAGFCCQGNILAGAQVVAAMAQAFRASVGPLPERMIAALEAGQQAGGDRRGKQSAALYVARADSGFAWMGDRYIDIRVDDHPEPIQELDRLMRVYRAGVWGRLMEPVVTLDAGLIQFLQSSLRQAGRLEGEMAGEWDTLTSTAAARFCEDHGLYDCLPLDGVTAPRSLFQVLLRESVR
jgi:uncharacterized Ntn-hydrolase superfamily protein